MSKDTQRRLEIAKQPYINQFQAAFTQVFQDVRRLANLAELEAYIASNQIEEAVRSFRLGAEILAPLVEAVRRAYTGGADYQIDTFPKRNPRTGNELIIRFQGRHERAERWVSQASSKLVTNIVNGQRDLIRSNITQSIIDGKNPNRTALDLVGRVSKRTGRRTGGVIGLDSNRAGFVENYRQKLIAEGRATDQITRMVTRYENKKLLERGASIARTETTAAMNAGRLESIQQLADSGEIESDAAQRVWDATGDARTRDDHMDMEGQAVRLDEPFISPSGARLMHPGDSSLGATGADVIGCRCHMRISIDFMRELR